MGGDDEERLLPEFQAIPILYPIIKGDVKSENVKKGQERQNEEDKVTRNFIRSLRRVFHPRKERAKKRMGVEGGQKRRENRDWSSKEGRWERKSRVHANKEKGPAYVMREDRGKGAAYISEGATRDLSYDCEWSASIKIGSVQEGSCSLLRRGRLEKRMKTLLLIAIFIRVVTRASVKKQKKMRLESVKTENRSNSIFCSSGRKERLWTSGAGWMTRK